MAKPKAVGFWFDDLSENDKATLSHAFQRWQACSFGNMFSGLGSGWNFWRYFGPYQVAFHETVRHELVASGVKPQIPGTLLSPKAMLRCFKVTSIIGFSAAGGVLGNQVGYVFGGKVLSREPGTLQHWQEITGLEKARVIVETEIIKRTLATHVHLSSKSSQQ